VSARLNARAAPLDERARTIIQAARQRYPGGRLPPGVRPPLPPPELYDLQRQRDALVEQAAQELEAELGPAAMTRLSGYVSKSLSTGAARQRIVRTPGEIGSPGPRIQSGSPAQEGTR
jgi:hypothetical protein